MGAVFVANRYVPRPPEDQFFTGLSKPPSLALRAALAANIPFRAKFWRANYDDAAIWRSRSGAVSLTLLLPPAPPSSGPPAMATVYVPNPGRDDLWLSASQDMPLNLRSAAAAPFFPSWDGLQSIPADQVWTGEPGSATWILTTTTQLYAGKQTQIIPYDEVQGWTPRSTGISPLLRQAAATPAPFVPMWESAATVADPANWTGKSGGATWLLSNTLQIYVGGSTRIIPFEDTAPWVRTAPPANFLLLQTVVTAPFVPSTWDQHHQDVPAAQIPSRSMSSLLLPQPAIKPFVPALWDQNFDDAAVQNRGAAVAPVLGLAGGNYPVVPSRWDIPGDDASVLVWHPGNVGVTLRQLLNAPLIPAAWRFGQDDATPAAISSTSIPASLRKLAAGSVVIPGRWKFDHNDASHQPGGASAAPSRELMDALALNVPFRPVYLMPGIDEAVLSVRTFNRGALSLPLSIILNPNYIARGDPRRRVIIGISNQMSHTNDLAPPIDDTVEIETVTFDFGRIMDPGVVITGISALTCVVWKTVLAGAADQTPQARIIGAPAIVVSPNSCDQRQAVSQLVGTMVAGLVYRLQCVVTTSDGQTLSLWSHLACESPN